MKEPDNFAREERIRAKAYQIWLDEGCPAGRDEAHWELARQLVTIEDNPGEDSRRQQMVEFVAGLNVEEQTDLLALTWLGRGDYDIDEWDDALAEAEARIAARNPDYMIGDAALPEYLGDGLEAFGMSCLDSL